MTSSDHRVALGATDRNWSQLRVSALGAAVIAASLGSCAPEGTTPAKTIDDESDTANQDTSDSAPDTSDTEADTGPACPSPVSWAMVAQGEDDPARLGIECESMDACCQDLHVSLAKSSEELSAAYENLPNAYLRDEIPEVDFSTYYVVVSYTTECSSRNHILDMTSICADGTALTANELLTIPSAGPTALSRPFNVVTIPIGDYDAISGSLETRADTGG